MEVEALSGSWAFKLLLVVCVLLLLRRFLQHLVITRFFPFWMNRFHILEKHRMRKVKKDMFASLSTAISHDPELRKRKALRILEIGAGTGTNFYYYPDGTHLTVVDPNPNFKSYYDKNRHKYPNIHYEEVIVCTGEEMDMVKSNSIDVVVCTFVFCSVTNAKKVLQQILRVLASGGRFYFLDHIAEFDTVRHCIRRLVQELLTRLGIWPFLFGGCQLNRDKLEDIQKAGFSKVQAQRMHVPYKDLLHQVLTASLVGMAEK